MSSPAPSKAAAKPVSAGAPPRDASPQDAQLTRLVLELLRPYRGWLVIVFAAMLVEIAMSLAAPWPLKLVLDDALGNHKLPEWLAWAHDYGHRTAHAGVALFAGLATLVIAVIGAIATYIDNYYTTSVGQWVANDLRIRIYEHLHRLSLRFYDTAKTGALMSTITSDVATVQRFRVVVDARHRRRHHDHRLHAGPDVLARLGLHADRRRRHALPAACSSCASRRRSRK